MQNVNTNLCMQRDKALRHLIQSVILILGLGLSGMAIAGSGEIERWYNPQQVERGSKLFQQHCAQCHGSNAEGTADWKTPLADGSYPPPPLNGTAHAWHHDLTLLRRTIGEGGAAYNGKMPPFGQALNSNQVDAIIAWFQSLWSDEIYRRWRGDAEPEIVQPEIIQKILGNLK